MKLKVFQHIHIAIQAIDNCLKAKNLELHNRHMEWEEKVNAICKEHLPSGSGFDRGTKFSWDESRADKLVFRADYHHMNHHGYYDGWSNDVKILLRPTFQGFDMSITGLRRKNRHTDLDMWYDIFRCALEKEIDL